MAMRRGYFILRDRQIIPVTSAFEWAVWMNSNERVVAQDTVGETRISTVFLGLDHNFDDSGPPLLFETMIFGGPLDQTCRRYSAIEDAEAGHAMFKRQLERGDV